MSYFRVKINISPVSYSGKHGSSYRQIIVRHEKYLPQPILDQLLMKKKHLIM